MKRLFKRKRNANMSHDEMVLTIQQQKEIYKAQMEYPRELRRSIIEALDEIEDSEVEIDETEVAERVAGVFNAFDTEVPDAVAEAIHQTFDYSKLFSGCVSIGNFLKKKEKHKQHTCTQCGAPLHDGKCDYCGTEYK